MENFSIIMAVVGAIQPPIVEIFKWLTRNWFTPKEGEKISDQAEQAKKSIILLFSLVVGAGASLAVNALGGFDLLPFQAVLYGTGLAVATGEVTRRTTKLIKADN